MIIDFSVILDSNGQVYKAEIVVTQLADKLRNFVCARPDGKVAYAIEGNGVYGDGPLGLVAWTEISVDSEEVSRIKHTLFPGKTLGAAFRASNVGEASGVEYNYAGSFTYLVSANIDDYPEWKSIYEFTVVGEIPELGTKTKRIKLSIPEIGFKFNPCW